MVRLALLALLLVAPPAAVPASLAAPAPRLAAGDPCELLEGLPGPRDPLRTKGPYAKALGQLDAAGANGARLAKAFAALTRVTDKLLARARKVFHPRRGKVDKAAARRFLERYVLGRDSVLVIADDRFAPAPALQAAIVHAACRSGQRERALALARRGASQDPALAALAALMLLDAGRPDEARELQPRLTREGFLSPWVLAELSEEPAARQEAHAIAARRVTTAAQQAAVEAQRRRLAAPAARPPAEDGGG